MARNFKALIRTGTVQVFDGSDAGPDAVEPVTLTLRKRGALSIAEYVARVPLLADAIEQAAGKGLALKGGPKGATLDGVRGAVAAAADEAGTGHGAAVRDLVVGLPGMVRDILVEDTVLDPEESVEDYRAWVCSLGPSALCDAVIGWVELNLPEFRGPLVAYLVRALQAGRAMTTSLASQGGPDIPGAPAAATTVPTPPPAAS